MPEYDSSLLRRIFKRALMTSQKIHPATTTFEGSITSR